MLVAIEEPPYIGYNDHFERGSNMLLFTYEHVHFMASLLQGFAPLHEVHHSTAVDRRKHEDAATTGDVTYEQTNQHLCQDRHVQRHLVRTSLLRNEHKRIRRFKHTQI